MPSVPIPVADMDFVIWNLTVVFVMKGGQVQYIDISLYIFLIWCCDHKFKSINYIFFCNTGLDCSQIRDRGFWTSIMELNGTRNDKYLPRSQSSGSVWKGLLWVVGGHGLDLNLSFTMAFNISGLTIQLTFIDNMCVFIFSILFSRQ